MICENCKTEFEKGRFCPECGKPIKDEACSLQQEKNIANEQSIDVNVIQENDAQKKKKSRRGTIIKWYIILTVISIVLIVIIGIFTGGSEETIESNATKIEEKEINDKEETEEKDAPEAEDTEKSEMQKGKEKVQREDDIIRATAEDENDLTGTYKDTENELMLQLIVEDNMATYSFSTLDGSDPEVEQECPIQKGYIEGQFYYITSNLDGTMSISSGVGEPLGSLKKVSDVAEIDLSYDMSGYVPEEAEYNDEYNSIKVYEEYIARDIVTNEHLGESQMADDGSYLDEIVSGAWYNEDGTPKAEFPPSRIYLRPNNVGYFWLEDLHFVDGINYTIDNIKRSSSDQNKLTEPGYILLLNNIYKEQDSMGNIYIVGWEYFSSTPVVLHGNFSDTILNGDNIMAITVYEGLASDDTPNFNTSYIEICNDRF